MPFPLRTVSCLLACASAALPEPVSFMQDAVLVHRHQARFFPDISAIAGSVAKKAAAVIDSVKESTQVATGTVVAGPAVQVLGKLHNYVVTAHDGVVAARPALNATTNATVLAMTELLNGPPDLATKAKVNAAVNAAVPAVDDLTVAYGDDVDWVATILRHFLNELGTAGFGNLGRELSNTLNTALAPLEQSVASLRKGKAALERAAEPWTTAAESDLSLKEAIADFELAIAQASKKTLVGGWVNSTVDEINKVAASTIAGDQAQQIAKASEPIKPDVTKLLDDITGLVAVDGNIGEVNVELRKYQAVTHAAAASAAAESAAAESAAAESAAKESAGPRSAAAGPRSFCAAAGGLVLIALTAAIA